MRLKAIKGSRVKRISARYEKDIYELLHHNPDLLEDNTQWRFLGLNKGPEKGPDFIAVNRMGDLLLGEIKCPNMRREAWPQIKKYALHFSRMREAALNKAIAGKEARSNPLKKIISGFLNKTGRSAIINPSRRKLQLVLIAENFSDDNLRLMNINTLGKMLRKSVKDVKCIEIQVYKTSERGNFVITSIVSGRRRKLRR